MRRPQPFYKKSRNTWYVQLDGRQINLGPNEEAAFDEYHRLMLQRGVPSEALAEPDALVIELCQKFLAWQKRRGSEGTYDFYFKPLDSFTSFLGPQKKLRDLKPYHVQEWLDTKYPKVGQNYRYNLIRAVKRPFNWARKLGYLASDPLAMVSKGSQTSRQCYIEPDQWNELMRLVKPGPFRDFLILLRATGARPQEVRKVEARHFDRKNECWRFPVKETKMGLEERIIHLNDAAGVALALTKRRVLEYPEGPIFRNSRGLPWTKNALRLHFRQLRTRKKNPLTFSASCYVIRHTYATDALAAGIDIQTVATQLGHRDLRMLSQVYQHLKRKQKFLKEAQAKATAGVLLDVGWGLADQSCETATSG
jgi:integrase